jgi:uncharacterized protein
MPLEHIQRLFCLYFSGYQYLILSLTCFRLNILSKENMKKTIVLGASPNRERYAYKATKKLKAYGYEVIPIGIKKGEIEGVTIQNDTPQYEGIDTITLYLNPENQKPYYDYIFSLKPKRIIFNPGTENMELMKMAKEKGIESEVACTLVLLSLGDY